MREMAELVKSELNKLAVSLPSLAFRLLSLTLHAIRFYLRRQAQHGPLLHNGRHVDVNDIVLVRIEHVSKGSFQPILATWSGT